MVLSLNELGHVYPDGTRALKNVNLTVERGEVVAVIGPSGAGKSTLLRCVNGLVRASEGDVSVLNEAPAGDNEWRRVRKRIGMIFQSFNLIPRTTTVFNVLCGALGRVPWWRSLVFHFTDEERSEACRALDRVGLGDKIDNTVDELSGGERQRVGMARALMQRPELLLADEPVSSLDPVIAASLMSYLAEICREEDLTALFNLHSVELAREHCQRVVGIHAGEKVYDGPVEELDETALKRVYGEAYSAA